MSKFQYTIPTPYGTETRTSARLYTHIVVAGVEKESLLRKHLQEAVEGTGYFANGFCAEYRQRVLAMGLEGLLAKRTPLGLLGYCSNLKLAQRRAAAWDALERDGVLVIAITPEMVREIKPRARKEAV